jgi:hypothetical protein
VAELATAPPAWGLGIKLTAHGKTPGAEDEQDFPVRAMAWIHVVDSVEDSQQGGFSAAGAMNAITRWA